MKHTSEIDFLLDDIRKACELGEIEEVIKLSEKLRLKNETPLNWLIKKFKLNGSTYIQPNFTLRQCAGFIQEYCNLELKESKDGK